MRIITFNANGLRAAERKGFFNWLRQQNADIVCIQETKAQAAQLQAAAFSPPGFHCYYHDAEKKGYSGVALYAAAKPERVIKGIGWADVDVEGRYLEARFGRLSIISLYLPSGTSGKHRQAVKYQFLDRFLPHLEALAQTGRDYIICGDWNIAHKNIDLKNWRGNQKNSGFLPEERAWLDRLFDTGNWLDGFRLVNQEPEQYTWWSHRGQAWANNVGWRIDYQVISASLKDRLKTAAVYKSERFSDHAPLIMDYDYGIEAPMPEVSIQSLPK